MIISVFRVSFDLVIFL